MPALRPLLCLLAPLLLSACGYNTAVLRIVEYRANTPLAALTGAGHGIAVHQAGAQHSFAHVHIHYQGQHAEIHLSTPNQHTHPDAHVPH